MHFNIKNTMTNYANIHTDENTQLYTIYNVHYKSAYTADVIAATHGSSTAAASRRK